MKLPTPVFPVGPHLNRPPTISSNRYSSIPIPPGPLKRAACKSLRIQKTQRSLWSLVIRAGSCPSSLNGSVAGRENMSSASNQETAARKEGLHFAIGMGASWRRGNLLISQCGCVFWDPPVRIFIPKEKKSLLRSSRRCVERCLGTPSDRSCALRLIPERERATDRRAFFLLQFIRGRAFLLRKAQLHIAIQERYSSFKK
jgi:hypothetical protein